MYFPYLRGKQFELLALRELGVLLAAENNKISPLIEPVKLSPAFSNALVDLRKFNVNFTIILNPSVGDLKEKSREIARKIEAKIGDYPDFQIGILVSAQTPFEDLLALVADEFTVPRPFTFVHNEIVDGIQQVLDLFSQTAPIRNNVISFQKTSPRYYRRFGAETRVSLFDYFSAMPKNADYLGIDESAFSEEHLFFREDNFKGFSDFLTIGEKYADGGFAPYAVAIHLSYADSGQRIRIKHFVSDSNDDWTDVAGKFSEANQKLVRWCREYGVRGQAIDQFFVLHETGHFPGLGTIKKLSIMNHIELVLSLI